MNFDWDRRHSQVFTARIRTSSGWARRARTAAASARTPGALSMVGGGGALWAAAAAHRRPVLRQPGVIGSRLPSDLYYSFAIVLLRRDPVWCLTLRVTCHAVTDLGEGAGRQYDPATRMLSVKEFRTLFKTPSSMSGVADHEQAKFPWNVSHIK